MESTQTIDIIRRYCIQRGNTRCLYSLPLTVLNSLGVTTWRRNRGVDYARVNEIVETIIKNNRVVGIIFIAELNNKLQCYDGNHRRLALREIVGKIDNVLVMITWNASEDSIIDEFNDINLAVPVSAIHTNKEITDDNKSILTSFVSHLVTKYPTMTSTSHVCYKPRFNVDVLELCLFALYEEHKDMTAALIVKTVRRLNKAYSLGEISLKRTPLTPEIQAKCEQSGLWLFCLGRTINDSHFMKIKAQMK